jgi:hypothetical protein
MWLAFIVVVVIILFGFDLIIKLKVHSLKNQTRDYIAKTKKAHTVSKKLHSKIVFLTKEKSVAEEIYASNTILKDSIKNLFDLVPDQITLRKVIMKKDSLTLYGISPSKDTFNFLLGSPLKSIFQSSNTIFYLNSDGWYRFVSSNKIINEEDRL